MYFVFSCKITGAQLFSFKGFVLIHLNWSAEFLSGCTIYLIFSYLDQKYALPFLLKLTDSMTKLVMLCAINLCFTGMSVLEFGIGLRWLKHTKSH